MLEIGHEAPEFSGKNQNGDDIHSTDYVGKHYVVLYFYPKDDTPGCTLEAQEFSAMKQAFEDADAVVFGVSKDDVASHKAFCDKYDLKIDLLEDATGKICEGYDVWKMKQKDGISKLGIIRSTFIIDKDGKIAWAKYNVKPEGQAQATLDVIRGLD